MELLAAKQKRSMVEIKKQVTSGDYHATVRMEPQRNSYADAFPCFPVVLSSQQRINQLGLVVNNANKAINPGHFVKIEFTHLFSQQIK